MWRHRGLVRPIYDIYDEDGIHLNRHRQALLLRSYDGAILCALKQLQLCKSYLVFVSSYPIVLLTFLLVTLSCAFQQLFWFY